MEFIKKYLAFWWCPESMLSMAICSLILGIFFMMSDFFMGGIFLIAYCAVLALISVNRIKADGLNRKKFLIFLVGFILLCTIFYVLQNNDSDSSSDEDVQQQEYNEKLNEIEGEYEYYQDNDNYNRDFGDKYGYRIGE